MEWQMVLALVIAVPVILFPIAFIWFLNISGLWTVWKESKAREKRRAKIRQEALSRVK